MARLQRIEQEDGRSEGYFVWRVEQRPSAGTVRQSHTVRFWGRGGWEASPTRTARKSLERGAQPEASTASEDSAPNRAQKLQNPTTHPPSAAIRRSGKHKTRTPGPSETRASSC